MSTPEQDPVLAQFAALGETKYPGKTKPFSQVADEKPETSWDSTFRTVMWKGEAREFFMISQLAAALGRSVQSIRAWETDGKIPRSRYRTPAPTKGVGSGKPKGRRLWTREQIEGILRIAAEEEVILNDGPPPTKAFTARVTKLFAELAKTDH